MLDNFRTDKWWTTEFNRLEEVRSMVPYAPDKVEIYDVSIREGDQTPGCIMRTDEKIALAKKLDDLGVDYIEIFPVVSKDDEEATRILNEPGVLKHAKMSSLLRPGTVDLELAIKTNCPHVNIEGSGNIEIANAMLGISDIDKHIQNFCDCIKACKDAGKTVTAAPWDIGKAPLEVVEKWVKSCVEAGADEVSYCDTFGWTLPWTTYYMCRKYAEWAGDNVQVSCHFHNDFGLGTANTLAAIGAGAKRVQVALNNLGERAGNTPLEEVCVNLLLNMGIETNVDLSKLYDMCKELEAKTNIEIPFSKPITGGRAFGMGSGIVVDLLRKLEGRGEPSNWFLPFDPSVVGRDAFNVLWGKGCGSRMVTDKVESMGLTATKEQAKIIQTAIKDRALETKTIVPEKEVEAMIRDILKK